MKSAYPILALILIGMTALVGCATERKHTSSVPYPETHPFHASRYGKIDSIDVVRTDHKTSGAGVMSNKAEKNRSAQGSDQYQINVRLDSGDISRVAQNSIVDLRVGDRVRVVDGHVYRY